jgi:hypothetical protein
MRLTQLQLVYTTRIYINSRIIDNLIIDPYCFLKSHLPFDVLNLNSITELRRQKTSLIILN